MATTRTDINIFKSRLGSNYEMSGLGIQLSGGMATLHRISRKLQQRASDAALLLGGVTSRPATTVIMIRVGRYWSLTYGGLFLTIMTMLAAIPDW